MFCDFVVHQLQLQSSEIQREREREREVVNGCSGKRREERHDWVVLVVASWGR
jgi:hypothetical protein